jgi:molybdopterin molybdotransferase
MGLDADLLLVSGGVSMGKYDLVENIFAEFGVQTFFDKVAMKPGKPTVFGHRGNTYVFGLPGNPISTMVAFHLFVRPIILFLLKAEDTNPRILEARLEAPAQCDPQRAACFRLSSGLIEVSTGSGLRLGRDRRISSAWLVRTR